MVINRDRYLSQLISGKGNGAKIDTSWNGTNLRYHAALNGRQDTFQWPENTYTNK